MFKWKIAFHLFFILGHIFWQTMCCLWGLRVEVSVNLNSDKLYYSIFCLFLLIYYILIILVKSSAFSRIFFKLRKTSLGILTKTKLIKNYIKISTYWCSFRLSNADIWQQTYQILLVLYFVISITFHENRDIKPTQNSIISLSNEIHFLGFLKCI